MVSCSVAAVLSVCAGDGDSEEVWSAAGAPEHAAIDIAITTASIPFIILLILIIVSPLWNMFCFSSASLYNTVVKTNVQSRKNLSKFRHLFYAVLSLWDFINIIILKIPEAGTSSCFLCRIAEQTKPATSKMIQFEVQLMHGSDG